MVRKLCSVLATTLLLPTTPALAERTLDQITIARASDTAVAGVTSFLVPARSDGVLFRSLAADLLPFDGGRGHLANLFRAEPASRVVPIRIASGGGEDVALLGTDPNGRWLVLASTCRLDRPAGEPCGGFGSGFGQYLLDTQTGAATLITHAPGQPQVLVPDPFFPDQRADSRVSTDGRYVDFTSRVSGLVAGTNNPFNEPLTYRFDRVSGDVRRIGRFVDPHPDGYASRILWAAEDGSATLVGLRLGLIRFDANSAADSPVVSEQADWSATKASQNGAYAVRCDRFLEQSPPGVLVRTHYQFTRITIADGTQTVINPRASGLEQSDASCAASISNDGDIIVGPEGHAGPPFESTQVVRWTVSNRQRTLLTPRAGDALAPANNHSDLADMNADGSRVLIWSSASDLLAGNAGNSAGALYLYRNDRPGLTLVSRDPAAPDRALPARGRMTASGNWIHFESDEAPSTVRDDNRAPDLFAYHVPDGTVSPISRTTGGQPRAPNDSSSHAQVSDDGLWTAFGTSASNLIDGVVIPPESRQVMLAHADGRTQQLVSHEPGAPLRGAAGESVLIGMSADGRKVIYSSTSPATAPAGKGKGIDPPRETFAWDRDTGVRTLVTRATAAPGTGADSGFSIATDREGAWVLHGSGRPQALVPGYTAPSPEHLGTVLLRLPVTPGLEPELVTSAFGQPRKGPDAHSEYLGHSADLQQVAFASLASDLLETPVRTTLAQIYIADRQRGRTHWLTRSAALPGAPADTGMQHGSRVHIARNGRFAVFSHAANDLVLPVEDGTRTLDCYRIALDSGTVVRVSERSAGSPPASCDALSDDGRFVLYTEVPQGSQGAPAQVWRADLVQGTRTLVSQSSSGEAGDAASWGMRLSASGDQALFESNATNLVSAPAVNDQPDLYLRHLDSGTTELITNGDAPGVDRASGYLVSVTANPDFGTIVFADESSRLKPNIVGQNGSDLFVSRRTRIGDNPGVSGLWGEPGVEGQGFHLVSLPGERRMLLSWYTYLAEGGGTTRTKQRWLLGLGVVEDGVARFTVSAADDGLFDAAGAGAQVTLGEVILRFRDCNHAEAEYAIVIDGRRHAGLIPLTRITPDTVCSRFIAEGNPAISALPRRPDSRWQYGMGGAWHDAARPGQGLIVEVLPQNDQVIATWFTFDPAQVLGNGRQPPLWLASTGQVTGNRARLNVFESTGGVLDRPGGTTLTPVGSLELEAVSCSRLVATYSISPGGSPRSGQITLDRITPDVGCSP